VREVREIGLAERNGLFREDFMDGTWTGAQEFQTRT
jgi:hypothetical protein